MAPSLPSPLFPLLSLPALWLIARSLFAVLFCLGLSAAQLSCLGIPEPHQEPRAQAETLPRNTRFGSEATRCEGRLSGTLMIPMDELPRGGLSPKQRAGIRSSLAQKPSKPPQGGEAELTFRSRGCGVLAGAGVAVAVAECFLLHLGPAVHRAGGLWHYTLSKPLGAAPWRLGGGLPAGHSPAPLLRCVESRLRRLCKESKGCAWGIQLLVKVRGPIKRAPHR